MISQMSNEEIYKKMVSISEQMKKLYDQGDFEERNKLVPIYSKLYHAHDFGFQVGETILTTAWGHSQEAKIVEIKDNYFLIQNEKGWNKVVPGTLLMKVGE